MTDHNDKTISVMCDETGIFRIVIDVPGRPMNVLNHKVMKELEQVVTEIEQRGDIRLTVFMSGKESGFLAGADVEAIERITSSAEANRLLMQGQRLFERIQDLPMPTLAMIHGPCLGGGLELALACDYRIARDNSSTRIGMPEIKLGLIPGWGGTQRLPKQVGLRQSLSLILGGKHLTAAEAFRVGLIDQAISPDAWRDEVVRVISALANGRSIRRRRFRIGSVMRFIESSALVRPLVLSFTKKRLSGKFEHYPAIDGAINAIADSYRDDVDGYSTERQEFVNLIKTSTCRQLLRLFFSRERARNVATWTPTAARVIRREPISELGVIGAGAMGAGIAQVAATRGYEVRIKEMDDQAAKSGGQSIDRLVSQYSSRKQWNAKRRQQLRDRITIGADFDSFDRVDCVVEAVVERIDVKKSVLAEAERSIGLSSILATNTSALSVTELSKSLLRPSRFAGLHFFNPVHRMELVEVVRGEQTAQATIARLVSFVKALGKTPIVTSDSPGFLVNRILFPYLGEAVLMVRQGHDVETIDREIRQFGMPMGPLELLDRVGLDVALHVAGSLRAVLCDVDEVVEIIAPMVERKQIGAKSKLGFYDYRGKRKLPRKTSELVEVVSRCPAAPHFSRDGLTEIQRRLVYPMLAEAIRCDDEAVVEHPWAIDLAMVLGTGFAPHRGGPLSVVDQIGADTMQGNLDQLRSQFGERFTSPKKLMACCRSGERLS